MPTQPETGVDWFASLCEQAEHLGERLNQEYDDYAAYSSIMDAIGEAEAEHKAIRKQERQRVREALEGMVERQELNSQDCGWVVPTTSIEVALDSLEDSDA